MLLFNSIVFGSFVGFLVDYWLGRAGVRDSLKLVIAVVVGVIVGVLVFVGRLGVF
jgi:nitrate reductase gamma subunit